MSLRSRYLAIFVIIMLAAFMYAQDKNAAPKNGPTISAPGSGAYYAMDPVTGVYRLQQFNAEASLPTLRTDDTQPANHQNPFGKQWFQIVTTTGLSPDGKAMFVQSWFEKEVHPTQFDAKTGIPTQPRKMAIQEVIREVSLDKLKVQFYSAEGNGLSREEAGKLLKESKVVVLINGPKPNNRMLSVFGKNAVIAVYQPSPLGTY